MIFEMNGVPYTIIEVEQKEFNQIEEGDGYYFGQSRFFSQEIYLEKSLSIEKKRKTLYHELMHCYIREYLTTRDTDNFSEEMLCDISANAHDIIHEIVEEYFKNE
jgi:Zn-dependent peptidase ImmA (M78 family)